MSETYRYGKAKGGTRWHILTNPGGALCKYEPRLGWVQISQANNVSFVCEPCQFVVRRSPARGAS